MDLCYYPLVLFCRLEITVAGTGLIKWPCSRITHQDEYLNRSASTYKKSLYTLQCTSSWSIQVSYRLYLTCPHLFRFEIFCAVLYIQRSSVKKQGSRSVRQWEQGEHGMASGTHAGQSQRRVRSLVNPHIWILYRCFDVQEIVVSCYRERLDRLMGLCKKSDLWWLRIENFFVQSSSKFTEHRSLFFAKSTCFLH
jgi:hypothetical protein